MPIPEDYTEVLQTDAMDLPIGKKLKLERVAANVSLTDLAAAVSVSIGQLSRIESGQRTASPELIDRIRAFVRKAAEAAA